MLEFYLRHCLLRVAQNTSTRHVWVEQAAPADHTDHTTPLESINQEESSRCREFLFFFKLKLISFACSFCIFDCKWFIHSFYQINLIVILNKFY